MLPTFSISLKEFTQFAVNCLTINTYLLTYLPTY